LSYKILLNISTVHLDTLGIIPEFILLADIESNRCPVYEMQNPLKQGALDRFFLLDTVRHISSREN